MADDPNKEPDDEFRDMLREFLSGDSSIDPSQLAGAAGLPNDPAAIQQLLGQLQNALMNPGGGINWDLAAQQARTLASEGAHAVTPAERSALDQAFNVAALWLDEATTVAGLSVPPELIGRAVTKTDGDPEGATAREIRSQVRELVDAFPAYPRA